MGLVSGSSVPWRPFIEVRELNWSTDMWLCPRELKPNQMPGEENHIQEELRHVQELRQPHTWALALMPRKPRRA